MPTWLIYWTTEHIILSANAPGKTLATYIVLYLKEEVREELLVREIGAFARFLEASVMLLYRGTEKLLVDGIPCWPVNDFLIQLNPNHWP